MNDKTNDNNYLRVRGARQHNLKNVDLDIPKNQLVVLTGVSGSGKSSFAFDTVYAEGQRRYVESLSSYARQFLGVMQKPDVDSIEGLSPAISIDQKTTSHNPRSTVGTVTEIYDYMRLLFARVGHPHCPICGREISSMSLDQIVDGAINLLGERSRFLVLSPIIKDKKGEYSTLFDNLKSKGFKRVRVDGRIYDLDEDLTLIKTNKHTIEAVTDRVSVSKKELRDEAFKKNFRSRLADSIQKALLLADGLVVISLIEDAGFEMPETPKQMTDHLFSEKFSCPVDNISLPEIEPRSFSFNTPHGACPTCTGLGKIMKVEPNLVFSDELTIGEGGILPFGHMFDNDTWFSRLIIVFCERNGIDTHIATKKLTEEDKQKLLDGTADKEYKVDGTNRFGKDTSIYEKFEGITNELNKRYASTESEAVRQSVERFMREVTCPTCNGKRLNPEALSVTINDKSIADVSDLPITECLAWTESLDKILNEKEIHIGKIVLKEIGTRLKFLVDVGLDYLTLSRPANTLAGGEAQRIRLASQVGSGLTGVLYVLDEPTIGLHSRDNERLITTLKRLKSLGNTVLVVEHDKDMMMESDYIVDFGPGAGRFGGNVIAEGTIEEILKNKNSITGAYLSGRRKIKPLIPPSTALRAIANNDRKYLEIIGASQFNLKNVDVKIPLGKLVVVTGVSGSGKSTLVVDTIYHAVAQQLNRYHKETPGAFKQIEGLDNIDKIILIDQSPIGRTPRSNPATYTKMFDLIRDVFTNTKEAKIAGFKKGRFSFNTKGGRCEACEGQGQTKIEMQFMPDVWVPCEVCGGKRYNQQTLEITYKGKNISEVLDMTVAEAREFFAVHEPIMRKIETLMDVGLDYVQLGQPATTLSGGEAQRVKLSSELSKRATGRTLYILDEPTTGLHFADLEKLLTVLKILASRGNTVLVIEHNLDIIKNADWIIDLGPDGGDKGGEIVAVGTPKDIANAKNSWTGKFLKKELN
ncbi:excinuclease ABC subunit UvrA [soil metagenome]